MLGHDGFGFTTTGQSIMAHGGRHTAAEKPRRMRPETAPERHLGVAARDAVVKSGFCLLPGGEIWAADLDPLHLCIIAIVS
jgi:hypothetical protein